MAQDLDSIAGVVQCFFGGKYEGTLSDFSLRRSRAITQTGCADGKNRSAVGIEKPSISFRRPTLKSTARQVSLEMLNGPIDIDIVLPGSDQQWRVVAFRRADANLTHNPDQGNTSEDYSGPAEQVIRIK